LGKIRHGQVYTGGDCLNIEGSEPVLSQNQ
jgi:hypothetical protein